MDGKSPSQALSTLPPGPDRLERRWHGPDCSPARHWLGHLHPNQHGSVVSALQVQDINGVQDVCECPCPLQPTPESNPLKLGLHRVGTGDTFVYLLFIQLGGSRAMAERNATTETVKTDAQKRTHKPDKGNPPPGRRLPPICSAPLYKGKSSVSVFVAPGFPRQLLGTLYLFVVRSVEPVGYGRYRKERSINKSSKTEIRQQARKPDKGNRAPGFPPLEFTPSSPSVPLDRSLLTHSHPSSSSASSPVSTLEPLRCPSWGWSSVVRVDCSLPRPEHLQRRACWPVDSYSVREHGKSLGGLWDALEFRPLARTPYRLAAPRLESRSGVSTQA